MGTFLYEVRTNYCKKLLFVVSLQKKSSTRQFESKLSLRSFAFSLHRQPMKVLRGASQEASITTKGGHNRRQAPVIY